MMAMYLLVPECLPGSKTVTESLPGGLSQENVLLSICSQRAKINRGILIHGGNVGPLKLSR